MENSNRYFYITYPVPIEELDNLPHSPFNRQISPSTNEPLPAYPQGFMPEWFQNGSFPEDDLS